MSIGSSRTSLFPGFSEVPATRRKVATFRPGGPLAVSHRPLGERPDFLRKPQGKEVQASPLPLFEQAQGRPQTLGKTLDAETRERTEPAPEPSSQGGHEEPASSRVVVHLDLSRTTFRGRENGRHSSYLARVAAARARLSDRNQPLFEFDVQRPKAPDERAPDVVGDDVSPPLPPLAAWSLPQAKPRPVSPRPLQMESWFPRLGRGPRPPQLLTQPPARRRRPVTSSPPSARSNRPSRSSGNPLPMNGTYWPASAGSARWRSHSFPTR